MPSSSRVWFFHYFAWVMLFMCAFNSFNSWTAVRDGGSVFRLLKTGYQPPITIGLTSVKLSPTPTYTFTEICKTVHAHTAPHQLAA